MLLLPTKGKKMEKKNNNRENTFIIVVFILEVLIIIRFLVHPPTCAVAKYIHERMEERAFCKHNLYTTVKGYSRSQKYDKSWPRALISVAAPSFNWTRNIYYHFMRFASKSTRGECRPKEKKKKIYIHVYVRIYYHRGRSGSVISN